MPILTDVFERRYNSQGVAYDDWEPDLDVSCSVPDFFPQAVAVALGAVVVVAVLVVAGVQRITKARK